MYLDFRVTCPGSIKLSFVKTNEKEKTNWGKRNKIHGTKRKMKNYEEETRRTNEKKDIKRWGWIRNRMGGKNEVNYMLKYNEEVRVENDDMERDV